jgi:hypothetical protein
MESGRGAMALATCYECGKQVSTLAATCPHCGAPARSLVPGGGLQVHNERLLYQYEDLLISTHRIVVGSKTLSVRGLTSVEVRGISPTQKPGEGRLGGGGCLATLGLGAGLGSQSDEGAWQALLILLIGLGLMVWGWIIKQRSAPSKTFVIYLRSASGEQQVYASQNEAHIREIANKMTEAITAAA